jgi:hypothetical protein
LTHKNFTAELVNSTFHTFVSAQWKYEALIGWFMKVHLDMILIIKVENRVNLVVKIVLLYSSQDSLYHLFEKRLISKFLYYTYMMDKCIAILNNLVFSRKTMKYTCFSNMSIYFLALMFGICIWIQTIFWNGHMVTVWSWEIEITFSMTVCSLYLFTVDRYFSSTSILTCKQFKSNHTAACKLNKISNIIWVGSTESRT